MNARTIRRAAERQAAKLARKAGHTTAAQIAANRTNAQASTGPRTETGRQASSQNAISHGLTAMKALLPSDSASAYEQHVASHISRYSPVTDEECELVQLIADSAWRLFKIAPREEGTYEVARLELAEGLFADEKNPIRRATLIDAKIAEIHEKRLRNLHLQERRLRNQHASDIAKLKELQKERLEKPEREAEENGQTVARAANIAAKCKTLNVAFNPAEFGFDFSLAEWTHYQVRQATHFMLCGEILNLNKVIAAYRAAANDAKAA